MVKRSTIQDSGKATIYNFLLNEVLASQGVNDYEFWVVAPWVTNLLPPDPYHVSFQEIVETKQEKLHLFDIFHQIAANGGNVYVTVSPDPKYYSSFKQLSQRNDHILIRTLSKLHTKAYVGRYGALDGSLNLTDGGVNQNFELFTYNHDERNIAQLRQICKQHFEQGKPL